MVVIGASLFGKIYAIPGVCYVATRFLHIFYVPFVPTSSWIVFDEANASFFSTGWQGHQLKRLHWGSIVAAWVRSFLIVCAILFVIVTATVFLLDRPIGYTVGAGTVVVLAVAGIWLSYRLAKPTPDLLRRLFEQSGAPPDLVERALQTVGEDTHG
jgi:hypothetical protein